MVYTEASAGGPALRLRGIGARCVRKSSCVRGSRPKTVVGGWCEVYLSHVVGYRIPEAKKLFALIIIEPMEKFRRGVPQRVVRRC